MAERESTHYLEVLQGIDKAKSFPIKGEHVIIGRSKHCDISLNDEGISRQHIELSFSDDTSGMVTVRDLKSRNGVFHKRERFTEKTIPCGDFIQIGETLIAIRLKDEATVFTCPDSDSDVRLKCNETEDTFLASIDVDAVRQLPVDFEKTSRETLETRLNALYRLGEMLILPGSLNSKLDAIMSMIFEVLPAEDGCILIHDKQTQQLVPHIVKQRTPTLIPPTISVSWTIINKCIAERIGVVAANALDDPRFKNAESIEVEKFRSVMSVPLFFNDAIWGVIFLNTALEYGVFTEDDLTFLTGIANKTAIVIEHHELMDVHIERLNLAEVGELIASLSHYIKNILFAFSSAQSLLDEALHERDFDTIAAVWPILKDNANHISELVNDMLYFSKDRAPHGEFLQLNAIIEEAISLYHATAKGKNISFVKELDPKLPMITFDAKSFHRVILNLLKNAIDAIPPQQNGIITFHSRFDCQANHIIISITDNGTGIPSQNRERIFHYLFSTKGYEGTGIGLFVTRKIIQEHGGSITVTSEVDAGATFTITLPLDYTPELT